MQSSFLQLVESKNHTANPVANVHTTNITNIAAHFFYNQPQFQPKNTKFSFLKQRLQSRAVCLRFSVSGR